MEPTIDGSASEPGARQLAELRAVLAPLLVGPLRDEHRVFNGICERSSEVRLRWPPREQPHASRRGRVRCARASAEHARASDSDRAALRGFWAYPAFGGVMVSAWPAEPGNVRTDQTASTCG